jgi:hypothetical protein
MSSSPGSLNTAQGPGAVSGAPSLPLGLADAFTTLVSATGSNFGRATPRSAR